MMAVEDEVTKMEEAFQSLEEDGNELYGTITEKKLEPGVRLDGVELTETERWGKVLTHLTEMTEIPKHKLIKIELHLDENKKRLTVMDFLKKNEKEWPHPKDVSWSRTLAEKICKILEKSGEVRSEEPENPEELPSMVETDGDELLKQLDESDQEPIQSTGLKLKGVKKLEIVEEDMDISKFSIVIGPLYVLNHLALNAERLPQPEYHPYLDLVNHPIEDDVEEWEYKILRNARQNQGFLTYERILRDRDGRSRFYGKGKITRRKRRGKRNILGNSWRKRGLMGNRVLRSITQIFLPKSWRNPPHNLNSIQVIKKPAMPEFALNEWGNEDFFHLPRFQTRERMPFNIINTDEPLHILGPRNKKTIFLQWSRGRILAIRDIRVDGIPNVLSLPERFAFFLDRNLGTTRLFIDRWKFSFGVTFAILVCAIITFSIVPW